MTQDKNRPPGSLIDTSAYADIVSKVIVEKEEDAERQLSEQPRSGTATRTRRASSRQDEGVLSKYPVLRSTWVKVCGALAAVNVIAAVVMSLAGTKGLDPQTAQEELALRYPQNQELLSSLNQLSDPSKAFNGPYDPVFKRTIDSFNESMDRLSGEEDSSAYLDPLQFRFIGQEAIYVAPKSR